MKLLHTSRRFGTKLGKRMFKSAAELPAVVISEDSPLLKTIGWVSAGVGALAIGVVVGRELRTRYKFKRRTPYDLYAHSGDEQDFDFGLGI